MFFGQACTLRRLVKTDAFAGTITTGIADTLTPARRSIATLRSIAHLQPRTAIRTLSDRLPRRRDTPARMSCCPTCPHQEMSRFEPGPFLCRSSTEASASFLIRPISAVSAASMTSSSSGLHCFRLFRGQLLEKPQQLGVPRSICRQGELGHPADRQLFDIIAFLGPGQQDQNAPNWACPCRWQNRCPNACRSARGWRRR